MFICRRALTGREWLNWKQLAQMATGALIHDEGHWRSAQLSSVLFGPAQLGLTNLLRRRSPIANRLARFALSNFALARQQIRDGRANQSSLRLR